MITSLKAEMLRAIRATIIKAKNTPPTNWPKSTKEEPYPGKNDSAM